MKTTQRIAPSLAVLTLLLTIGAVAAPLPAHADSPTPSSAPQRSTRLLDFRAGPGLVGLAGGVGHSGFVAGISATLWCSERRGPLRFDLSLQSALGITGDGSWQAVAGPSAGAELFLLDWLSLELWVGVGAGGQLATRGPASFTAGLLGGGGWAVRPFATREHRLSLGLLMAPQFAFTDSSGNDCPLCHGLQAFTLSWRTPY